MMRKELKRLEIENVKLRETLKSKLQMKSSICNNSNKSKAMQDLQQAKCHDEFYEMIKIGFIE